MVDARGEMGDEESCFAGEVLLQCGAVTAGSTGSGYEVEELT